MIDAHLIDQLGELFEDDAHLQMATVATPLLQEEYDEPSAVKVILNKRMMRCIFPAP